MLHVFYCKKYCNTDLLPRQYRNARFWYWYSLQSLSPLSLSMIRKQNKSATGATLTSNTMKVKSRKLVWATANNGCCPLYAWWMVCWTVKPTAIFYHVCIFKCNALCCMLTNKKNCTETEESFCFIFPHCVQSGKLILDTICPWSRDYNPYHYLPLAKEILIHAHMVTRSRASADYVSPVHISCYQLTCLEREHCLFSDVSNHFVSTHSLQV